MFVLCLDFFFFFFYWFLHHKVEMITSGVLQAIREDAGLGCLPASFTTNADESLNSLLKCKLTTKRMHSQHSPQNSERVGEGFNWKRKVSGILAFTSWRGSVVLCVTRSKGKAFNKVAHAQTIRLENESADVQQSRTFLLILRNSSVGWKSPYHHSR